ncbi:redoxin domain-containing protein [Pedobacter hartonius]|uniref:Thioredoxin peroxidase n=1 Tax=Pedobacter hartonius TaxID=425514 RepID=A0A1H4HBK1_9SPHI|nr:redoxin domain-containing protein [Pedobacter hartonius]SEB19065.1 peroxiredoxin (alkyl hydroperoxide reductase subunit C) [Pedobacter hartonius]
MSNILSAGTPAPDFALQSTAGTSAGDAGEMVKLSDLKGKNVVLAFYPADWSAVCGDQLALYNELIPMFEKLDAELIGISVDSAFCHQAFRENREYKIRLLADFEPKGEVARKYGVYREQDGFTERALFVIDAEGVIRWSYLSPMEINPGANHILEALKEIKEGVHHD